MPDRDEMVYVLHVSVQRKLAQLARRKRQVEKENRRIIKRSVKLLGRVIGDAQTRRFVHGDPIRVTGLLAVWEMRRLGSLFNAEHGQHALRIIDKDDLDTTLCHLCVYSPAVPLLDHIASLVLHIRTGLEEDILRVGNATDILPEAYLKDWLRPHLPHRSSRATARLSGNVNSTEWTSAVTNAHAARYLVTSATNSATMITPTVGHTLGGRRGQFHIYAYTNSSTFVQNVWVNNQTSIPVNPWVTYS